MDCSTPPHARHQGREVVNLKLHEMIILAEALDSVIPETTVLAEVNDSKTQWTVVLEEVREGSKLQIEMPLRLTHMGLR